MSEQVKRTRPSKRENFLERAKVVSKNSTCLRLRVGAVIVSQDGVQLSDGYNGAPRKVKDCLLKGLCLRDKLGIPHGRMYELCASVHAEANAIINAARKRGGIENADMYIWAERLDGATEDGYPCFICKKFIINAGLVRVIISRKDGGYEVLHVDDWVEYWQGHDIIDDKQQYGFERNQEEGYKQPEGGQKL